MKKIIDQCFVVSFRAVSFLAYIFIICPWGFFYQLAGIDPLKRKIDKTKTSYWEDQAYEDKNSRIS